MNRLKPLLLGLLAVAACRENPSRVTASAPPPAVASEPARITVAVIGEVVKGGRYVLAADASIEDAFELAGGWSGRGGLGPDDGEPSTYFNLRRPGDPESKVRRVPIVVDKLTRKVAVVDPEWSGYKLQDQDMLTLPTRIW